MKTTTPTTTGTTNTTSSKHDYITKLPTFADRGQAIARRLESVKADPKYQALPEEKKARVREDLYNKYVPASYAGFHLPVPDKDTWVGATGRSTDLKVPGTKDEKLSDTYKDPRNKQFGQDVMAGIGKAYAGVELFGARIANKAFSKMFSLDGVMSHPDDSMLDHTAISIRQNVQRHLDNFIDTQHARIQTDDFWLQTHPRDTMMGKLGSMTGETLATLPLYEALSAIGVGAKVVAGASKLPLASKLAATPVGKFVAKRLISATDFYLATLAESGGSTKEAAQAAVAGAAAEAGLSVVGKGLKIAAAPLIKKWTANTIAMGGIPFAQDVAQSAMHEIEHEIEYKVPDGERKWDSLHRGITKVNPEEINARRTRFYAERERYDPVMAKLHAGEKVSLNSVAQAKFGKELKDLSLAQRREAFAKRIELIHQAAQEAPVHLPEIYKEEISESIAKERASSPHFNSLLSALEKQGVDTTIASVENGLATIAKETGISNTRGATKKLDKALKLVRSVGADLNKFEPDKSYSYAQYRGDTIAFMRAPRNRARLAAATSDRSAAGLNKFIDILKDATPGKMQFEDPAHLMLFHYGNADKLPSGFKETMQRRFKQLKGYENSTPASLRQEAGMLHSHLLTLGRSGKLNSEGYIYRSTKTQGPYSWTKWQTQLSDEVIADTIKPAQQALRNHPVALKSFNASINALKKTRPNLKTAEDVIKFERSISDASTSIVSHVADNKLGGIIQ